MSPHQHSRIKSTLLVYIAVIIAIFAISSDVYAYTVMSYSWFSKSTTYKLTNAFTNQSTGWAGRADSAASEWSSAGVSFTYTKSSTSGNYIDANTSVSCGGCLIFTSNGVNAFGYFTSFTMQVNLAPGYAFYDGTQASTLPSNYYDLRTLLRHEFGHALGLCHSSSTANLMYSAIGTGATRIIDTDAKNGAKYKYQSGYSGTGPSGACI